MVSNASGSMSTLPNWRSFQTASKDSRDEDVKLLSRREDWSKEAFAEAADLYERFSSCDDTYMDQEIKQALKVLDDALRLYGPWSVLCSFNGGKDACVILELVRAAHAKYYMERKGETPLRPRVVYWDKADEFPEVLQFVKDNVASYDLDMISFGRGVSFGDGLQLLVENNTPDETTAASYPMAFVLGTRSGDPNAGGQGVFAPSSSYMPAFMRVNPVITWNYGQVWQFLRSFHLPYCKLYEQGYTSLGGVEDTLKNPALFVPGETESEGRYREAWMLSDYELERAGRVKKTKKPKGGDDSSRAPSASTHLSTMSMKPPLGQIPSEVGSEDGDFSYGSDTMQQKTVGLLIIGDEILKGYTADTNTNKAALAFHNWNVLLKRVVVVSDNLAEIADEIVRS
jgi:FAD synthetase